MDYKEFLEITQKKRGEKNFKVSNSWGVHDALNYVRSHGWFDIGRPVTEHDFYYIIRNVNKLLAEGLVNGQEIQFPHSMGKLEIRRYKSGVFINDKGKLVNTYAIDWDKTMKLWYEDEEARNMKILVRHEGDSYRIAYNKYHAHYTNQIFYEFAPNRFMRRAVLGNMINGKIDTLW